MLFSGKLLSLIVLYFVLCNAAVTYTVSGMSSGGFMTVQMHVAYSSVISGAGVIAGGPYYCTLGSLSRLQTICTRNAYLIDLAPLISYANTQSTDQEIDPISNLQTSKVFIYSAKQDNIVFPAAVDMTLQFYQNFVNPNNILSVFTNDGGHTFPTISNGGPCWYAGSPYIGACNYDGAGAILAQLYGNLNSKGAFNNSNLFTFDQAAYADVWRAGMSSRGFVYAPYACRHNQNICRLHVAFHGCNQNFAFIGETYVRETGYGEWAESNNLVVIFPQTIIQTVNPSGCWDFGGVFSSNFALKSGPQ